MERLQQGANQKDIFISIVVPVYNEIENIDELGERLYLSLKNSGIRFEIIFVDDYSTDGTWEYLLELEQAAKETDNFRIYRKQGKRGKAFSLLQGFAEARGDVLAMIDGDLQYPPEEILPMVEKLGLHDIVVTNRKERHEPRLRRMFSHAFTFAFGKVLLRLDADVQSGLKVFRRDVLHNLHLAPTCWGFDYDFLYKAKRMGWRIGGHSIIFMDRKGGLSKITSRAVFELAWGAVALRLRFLVRDVLKFLDYPHRSERHAVRFDNTHDFLFLPEIFSVKKHIYAESVSLGVVVLAVAGAAALLSRALGIPGILVLSAAMTVFYTLFALFKIIVISASVNRPWISFSKEEIGNIRNEDLPVYTVLVPLYQEAEVIPQIMEAMGALDWPREKLEMIITLEEYDHATMEAIERAMPPPYIRTLVLPNVNPKTKPKALNVAFPQTKGEFLVIYDAEIIPDPDQLKKAYLAFRNHPQVSVLQTRLDHYNADQNVITKLFNAEFSFYYDLFLPGLQKLGYPIPLSGHSTHFRRDALELVGAWDPYNVTEDCDVGIRLARLGCVTDILDSMSKEEATSSILAWTRQRSRWMKGFIQTSIVHLRHPFRFKNEVGGWKNFCAFLFLVPGTVIINIFNLFYWILLAVWLIFHPPFIQTFFPSVILYLSVASFVVGNFVFTYLNLVGAYKRERYELVKYALLSPFYWILLAVATFKAMIQVVIKPHHWEKTRHGAHLREEVGPTVPMPVSAIEHGGQKARIIQLADGPIRS